MKAISVARKSSLAGSKLNMRNQIVAILFILPALLSFLLFKYYPIIVGVFISFFKIDIVNLPGEFVGLENYVRAFQDARFYAAMWHNAKFYIYGLTLTFWEPILLALLINEIRRGKTFFRLMFFLPAIAPAIAMSILWKFFWQPDYGLANYLLSILGMPPQLWLNSESLVYFSMTFPGMIICGGMNMIIYLAALQDVPQELYEAAMTEGAGLLRRIWHITMPSIKGVIATMLLLSTIGTFNALEGVMVMTNGGPGGSTETILLYAYKQATNSLDYSYAITMATIVFVITFLMSSIITKLSNSKGS